MSIAEKLQTIAENELKVYDAGEQKAIDDMWEALQGGGTRASYPASFFDGADFTKKTFKPKYDIRPTGTNTNQWVLNCPVHKDLLFTEGQVNMKELEQERGIVFDFSACTNFTQTFCGGLFSELNVIDISNATATALAFYGGYLNSANLKPLQIKRIEKLICSETTPFASNTFGYARNLEYIGFEGVVGKSIDLHYSPLSKASIESLVSCLSTNATGQTLTLNKIAKETAFTEEEWQTLIATKSNWTISLI